MTVYEKNKENLFKCIPDREKLIEKLDNLADSDTVLFDDSVLKIKKEDRWYQLTSIYDNKRYAKEYMLGKIKEIKQESVIWIFGFSNGDYVREILNNTSNNLIVVYEPDPYIFKCVLQTIDIADLIENERLWFAIGEIGDSLIYEYLVSFVHYASLNINKVYALPNYMYLYSEKLKYLIQKYKERYVELHMTKNTLKYFEDQYIENRIISLPDSLNQYGIAQIRDALKDYDMDKIPAFLVAAGPSLDKNVSELKKAENRGFILAVDTALKTLLRNDIMPDISITVDPKKPISLFEHEKFRELPLVVTQDGNSKIFALHQGKRFYFNDSVSYVSKMFNNVGIEMENLATGGSVATNAYSFLKYIGFKKIILVGQDLAYPNDQFHSKEAYDGKEKKLEDKTKYFYVEDINGGQVLTEGNMNMYRIWFQNNIERDKNLEVINATEGGALIKGAENMKLIDAINKYCVLDFPAKQILNDINPAFSAEAKKKEIEKIKKMPESLIDSKEKIKKGIYNYNRIIELASKGKMGNSEYNKLVKDNSKLYNEIVNDPIMEFPQMYTWDEEYEVQGNVFDYDKESTQYTQVKDTCKQGVKMLESYDRGIDEFLKVFPRLLENISKMEA